MASETAELPLSGQVALVTGSSRGIGAATAMALAAQGAHVLITARKVRDLEAVEDAIHEAGGSATIAPMDLTQSESIARLAGAVSERWDKLDILVISAATLPTLGPVTQIGSSASPARLAPIRARSGALTARARPRSTICF